MNKNKILIGLGTISAAAMPALAVVACGSEEQAPKVVATYTGKTFMDTVTQSKVETFLASFAKAGTTATDGSFEIKSGVTIDQYNAAATATGHKEAFDEVLALNKNDPALAIYVVNFTYRTIANLQLAFFGLKQNGGDADILALDKVTARNEIENGPLDAKTIADGIMVKFTIASKEVDGTPVSADPIWGQAVFTNYVNHGGTLTEVMPIMVTTMGGTAGVRVIVESAGYKYATAPASSPIR